MVKNKHVIDIKESVLALDQTNLFTDCNNVKLIESCIEYLRSNGYKVIKLPKYSYSVKSLKDLIDFFYSVLELKHPEYIVYYRNGSSDMALAKLFVKSRIKISCISKKEAFNECAEIIRTIFNHEEEFKFKQKITFKILGQNKSVWITDKAVQIMNRGLDIKKEELAEKMREKMIKAQDTENLGFNNLDEILDKLEKNNAS